jgi:hypothetical protein
MTEAVMAIRNKLYFAILAIVAQLCLFADVRAGEMQAATNAAGQETAAGPELRDMILVSFQPWVVEGQVLGALAEYIYDDVTTQRPTDYWELYDEQGELLAISWFDRFGIQRTAVDRGIVEQKDNLEGVFVVVLDGDAM